MNSYPNWTTTGKHWFQSYRNMVGTFAKKFSFRNEKHCKFINIIIGNQERVAFYCGIEII